MMPAGVEIEATWGDEDVLLLDVSASNGVFAGRAEAYGGRGMEPPSGCASDCYWTGVNPALVKCAS
jgi:hypothetical protein